MSTPKQRKAAKAQALSNTSITDKLTAQLLCSTCNTEPRALGGKLSVCMPCLRSNVELDRQKRAAAADRVAKAKAEKDAGSAVTLVCRSCARRKSLQDFSPHRLSRTGYRYDCKACAKAEKTKRRYILTEEQAAADRLRRKKSHRRVANRRAVESWQKRNPEAVAAKKRLRQAVQSGRVKKPEHCQALGCQSRLRLEAHHHDYRKPLDVVFVCARHHRRAHASGRLRLDPALPRRLAGIPALN